MKKLKAKTVIEDKFWIVEQNGSKIGTLKSTENGYILYNNHNCKEIAYEDLTEFVIEEKKSKTFVNDVVYGYPANTEQAHHIDIQDNVPVFKKTANSSVYVAAGYYCLLFPMGWRPSFCPRVDTLQKYTYAGPFKTESDMNLALKRKVQEHESFNS
jgi:hypothetical protein